MEKKRKVLRLAKYSCLVMVSALLLQACGSVPLTGRRQLQLVSDQEVIALSLQQYQDYMRTAPVEKGTKNSEMVTRVGTRISQAVETFLKNNGYETELQNFAWEFNLVKDESVNAFAMPGGKVVVYTGLLPITGSEDALAVVVGHEIAHVIAKHSSERISQQMLTQYGGAIAGSIIGGAAASELGQTVFGLGAQYGVMMPYARKQEYEADELGLVFMAMAGYDPNTAVPFWTRMAQSSQSGSVPEFLSTHPTDDKRISQIQKLMPNVLTYYKGKGVANSTFQPIETKTTVPKSSSDNQIKNAKTSKEWSF